MAHNRFRAQGTLTAVVLGFLVFAACSDESSNRSPSTSDLEAPASGVALADSNAARVRTAEVRQMFRLSHERAPLRSSSAGLAAPPTPAEVPLIGPGRAGFVSAGDRLHVLLRDEPARLESRHARVSLPDLASGAVRVEDESSGVALAFTLEHAKPVPAAVADGVAVYFAGLGSGADVIHRPTAEGTEDFVVWAARPDKEQVSYTLDVSKVPGLRFVSGVIELLDAAGAPRLRMSPPFVVDSKGEQRAARVALEGCAFDQSPAPPWDRAITPPGAAACKVVVSFDGSGLTYPVALDPTWTATGSMAYQRAYYPSLTLLSTGKVLAAGGYGCTPSCTYVGPTELYDRTSGTWATTGSLNNPRYYTSGEPLPSGGALVAGGYGSLGYLVTAERYDSSTGAWALVGAMTVSRYLHTMTALSNGKVLAAGGYGSGGYTASAELFDPALNTWSSAGNMPTGRYQHSATRLASGKVFVAGGYPSTPTAATYDPATNVWSAVASMSASRYGHLGVAIAAGNKVLVAGGYTSSYTNSAEIYDVASNSWSNAANLNVGRGWGLGGVLPNGKVLYAGGYGCPAGCNYLASSEVYDPSANTWTNTGDMTSSRYYADPDAVLLGTGEMFTAGGYGGSGYQNTAELFKLVPQGGPCLGTGECAAGYCVDGVCCDSPCTGTCQACTGAKKGGGLNGVCGVIANSTDPDSECTDQGALSCGTTGVCNGAGSCALYNSGTQCGTPSCSSGSRTTYACNGGGACLSTQTACAPYICASATDCRTNCTVDAQCAANAYCRTSDGTCQFDQANGAACTSAAQCSSGVCADGVCCATACTGLCQACSVAKKGSGVDGECGAIKDGSDPDAECSDQGAPSCQNDGQCNGAGACRKYAKGTSCGATTCVGNNSTGQVCDGFGACVVDTTGTNCAPYLCKGSSCANPCANDLDCVSGNFCEAGTCKPKQANGATCAGTNACTSGYCVDGVCCATACTGLCQACSVAKKGGGAGGECGPIKTGSDPDSECATTAASTCGTDGWCNGAGACRVWAKNTVCGADVCIGNSKTGKSCDGFGTCGNNASGTDCTPYVCGAGVCQQPCTTDTNCTSGNFCKAGVCTPKQANGAVCGGTNQCQSGYCVDGVCCATPCTGTCQACSAAKKGNGVDGECGAVSNGIDPDNDCPDDGASSCNRDGMCNGFGTCRQYAKGTACGSSACIGNKVSGQFCDGFGACQYDPVGTDCAPYTCSANKCSTPCGSDSDCTSGNYCDAGVCKGKQLNGAACTGNNQCSSNQCVDKVCCATSCTGLCQACTAAKKGSGVDGECGAIGDNADPDAECPDDGAATCDRDGMCNGFGACRLYKKGEACGATQCVGNLVKGQICDGLGSCGFDSTGTDCAPYVCAANACKDPCATNSDCLSGNFCDKGVCKSKQTNGSQCTSAADCTSGYCIDGVCCATACTGTCQACSAAKKGGGQDGECEPIKDGSDPDAECPDDGAGTCKRDGMCSGTGLCRYYSKGTTCKPGSTTCVGNFVKGYICDGLGTCENEPTGLDCAPHACLNNQCANPCATNTDCLTGNFCDAGQCKGKQPNGMSCSAGTQCQSGFCVDGVCCDSACNGQCSACDVAPNEGTCSPATGKPHGTRPECKGSGTPCEGTCDGVNPAACEYPGNGTACGTTCTGSSETPSFCAGNGVCEPGEAHSCSPYVCGTDKCKKSCEKNADCSSGYVCAPDKTCSPAGNTCSDDHTVLSPDGLKKDCSPYKCELGACKTACESVDDCVLPAVCSASDKTCRAPSKPAGDESGCGCRAAGAERRFSPGALGALALVLAFSLRRRKAGLKSARRPID
ncbi:MAG: hypothetical protein HYZ29_04755 [Myxococcales bacterium]|nr:hypothetical protein [Myxococcales bacterium]